MEEITIRKATLKDLYILLDFEQNIIKAERPFDATLKDGLISYYDIAYMIDAPEVEVVVAESGGEIIGSGYARIEDAKIYQKHQKYAYLGFMYVKPEHRGKGVNKNVIEALETWCLSQNIREIRLEVYNDNQPAVRAYEKTGFSKNLVEMRKGI
jgi:GNAT superfamily N-acetyltransferase